MIKRVFIIVLDSFGIGGAPDAAKFGDEGSNTLNSIASDPSFSAKNLRELGLFNIDGVTCLPGIPSPKAAFARLRERSAGKDTTIGHWEIAGIVSDKPLPTYPDGFPPEVIDAFESAVGRGVLCNKPYSGTKVIIDYGKEHIESGKYIVYTSADSVFQIAAHEDVISIEELYRACNTAREILLGDNAVGRVIARPFIGEYPNFKRTSNRRDFSLEPPRATMMDIMSKAGFATHSVGKIYDIFCGRGISEQNHTSSNKEGMNITLRYLESNFNGICFTNLVDFDMLWGHRNDVSGYAKGISEFDFWLGSFLDKMKSNDVLIITADHGCDPATESTDHSRECVPLIIYGDKIKPQNLGTRDGFCDIAKTVCDIFGISADIEGTSIKDFIVEE